MTPPEPDTPPTLGGWLSAWAGREKARKACPPRWHEAAKQVTATGWACTKCRSWCGDGDDAERRARACCTRSHPCACGGWSERPFQSCEACNHRAREERWAKLYEKAVPWDGESPLCVWDGDTFFFSLDDLESYLDGEDGDGEDGDGNPRTVEGLRLRLAVRARLPEFEMGDWLCDDPGEDDDTDFAEIDRVVNAWIGENVTPLWYGDGPAVTAESIRQHVREPGPWPEFKEGDDDGDVRGA